MGNLFDLIAATARNLPAKPAASPPPLEPIAELSAANDGNHLELPSHESPRYILTDATATPEWRHARDLYISHLMRCRACYAPRSRYCPDGAELRAQYDSTPMEATTARGGGG